MHLCRSNVGGHSGNKSDVNVEYKRRSLAQGRKISRVTETLNYEECWFENMPPVTLHLPCTLLCVSVCEFYVQVFMHVLATQRDTDSSLSGAPCSDGC